MTPDLSFTRGDLATASAILVAAARKLEARGEPLWPPGSLTPQRLLRHYPADSWVLAWQAGRPVACCSLLDADPLFWPDDPPDALYLHKLAVHPEAQGQGLAPQVLHWAARETARRGRRLLKLDTASARPKLCALYEQFGFQPVGQRDLRGFTVTLYQLPVS